MKQVIHLTEDELKSKIKENLISILEKKQSNISEEGHYPLFLDNFKDDVIRKVVDKLNGGGFRKPFYIHVGNNEYVRWIKVIPTYVSVDDIKNTDYYGAAYVATKTKFVMGKFLIGYLKLTIPYQDGKTNYGLVKNVLLHELNHLYDDWMKRTQQKKRGEKPTPLTRDKRIVAAYSMLSDKEFETIGDLVYRLLKTEEQAFISTVPNDLERLHATKENIKTKSRMTVCYKQAWESFGYAFGLINSCSDEYLERLNKAVREKYKNIGFPTMSEGDFNAEAYREKIWDWCGEHYQEFLKKYDRVVQYYLDHMPNDLDNPLHHHRIPNPEEREEIRLREQFDRNLKIWLEVI